MKMVANKFTKTINIENRPYEASIELARHHDTVDFKDYIGIKIHLNNIVYKFDGTLNNIVGNLPEAVRGMVLSEPSVILEYFEVDDYCIQFHDFKTLIILIKLIIGKKGYDIAIRVESDDIHAECHFAFLKIDELSILNDKLKLENERKDKMIKALEDKIRSMSTLKWEFGNGYITENH